jgi:nitroreductase
MKKIANTQHPVHALIKERWSARAFSDKNISDELLNQFIEAASWAASSMNEQPWLYYAAHRGTPAFNQMAEVLMPGNQTWAKEAAVLLISVARKKFTNGNPNRHYMHDVGAANQNLMLEATANGVLGHLMGGFDVVKTKEVFNLSEDLDPVVLIALGYPGSAEQLPAPFNEREVAPRSRKELSEILIKK